MKEEEIIKNVKRIIEYKVISNYINNNDSRAIQGLLDLYEKEKQLNECLLRDIYNCIQNDDGATILSIRNYNDSNTFGEIKDKYLRVLKEE